MAFNLKMQLIQSSVVFWIAYLLQYSYASSVGECRSECLEMNKYKIVRVHLKEDVVRAGVCRNVTSTNQSDEDSGPKSHVFPFICDRKIGIWEIDEQDEEGIVDFSIVCPQVEEVQPEILNNCPKSPKK